MRSRPARAGSGSSGIDLWLFGGLAKMDRDSRNAGEEFRVAVAGPVVTLLIALACFGGRRCDRRQLSQAVERPSGSTQARRAELFNVLSYLALPSTGSCSCST